MLKAKKFLKSDGVFAYLLILPATFALLMIRIVPLLEGVGLSFTNRRLLNDRPTRFIGLDNFIRIFTQDTEFWNVFIYTLIYTFCTVLFSYCIGLMIALLMNMKIKNRGLFRTLLLIPWIIPSVVAGASWQWALNDQTGIINLILTGLHLTSKPVLFLADPLMAKITVIMVSAWKNYPYMALSLLAGLQNVPEDIKEAARIDGANTWQVFFHVTLPSIKSVTMVCTTLMCIWTFNNFDNIYLLTMGGPDGSTQVVSILSYYNAFWRMNMGYASAISTVMLLFMIILATFYIKLILKNDE